MTTMTEDQIVEKVKRILQKRHGYNDADLQDGIYTETIRITIRESKKYIYSNVKQGKLKSPCYMECPTDGTRIGLKQLYDKARQQEHKRILGEIDKLDLKDYGLESHQIVALKNDLKSKLKGER